MKIPNGVIIYEGKSLIDSDPIVVIATGIANKSANIKTGNMIQTWIIKSNISPIDAKKNGTDISICGKCKHKIFKSCYVNVYQAPNNIYKTYKKSKYNKIDLTNTNYFVNRCIRVGSYGDPSAVPSFVWKELLKNNKKHTGYTHAWKDNDPDLKEICMASVDTYKEMQEAKKLGWRTFRTRLETDKVDKSEYICPASKEAGHKTTCERCGGCSGLRTKQKKTPVIIIHGSYANHYRNGINIYE